VRWFTRFVRHQRGRWHRWRAETLGLRALRLAAAESIVREELSRSGSRPPDLELLWLEQKSRLVRLRLRVNLHHHSADRLFGNLETQ